MPQIPFFINTKDVPTNPGPPTTDPNQWGMAGNALARSGAEVSDVMAAFNQRYQDAQRQGDAADRQLESFQRIDDAENRWSKVADRTQAMQGFNDEVGQIKQDMAQRITDPQVRAIWQEGFDKRAITGLWQTGNAAFGLESSTRAATLDDHLTGDNGYTHQLAQAKSDIERAQILDAAKGEIFSTSAAHWITPEDAEKRWLHFQSEGDRVRAEQDTLADPATAAKQLADPKNYPMLDEHLRDVLTYRAEVRAGAQDAVFRGDVASRLNDNLASIENTGMPAVGLSEGEIRRAFPGQADEKIAALNRAQSVYKATQSVALTSPQEDQAMIANFEPHGRGYAEQIPAQNAVIAAVKAKYDALDRDPAAYVLGKAPQLGALFNDAAKDPSKLPAAAAALDAAYDKLGVPSWSRPLLPKGEADAQVQRLLSAPPDQRAAALSTMATRYGDLWPRVMGDLVNAKLPAAYEVLAAVPSSTARIALSDAIGDGKKSIKDAVPPEDAQSIARAIEDSATLHLLGQSFGYAAGGAQKMSDITDALKMMAYRFAASGRSATDAAADAVASVTTDKYDFMSNGGGVARVPKGKLGEIESAADQALDGLKPDALAVPANPSGAKLTDKQLLDIAHSAAQRGRWVTNERDDGLVRLDVNGLPVMLRDGTRLEVPFAAALAAGKADAAKPPASAVDVPEGDYPPGGGL